MTPLQRGFAATVEPIGDALFVVAAIGVLFEFEHFRAFYEGAIRTIMTTPAFVTNLEPQNRKAPVKAVVAADLGEPRDSVLIAAFTADLFAHLDTVQYVTLESREITKQWVDGSAKSPVRSTNRMTRHLRVFGDTAYHEIEDFVGLRSPTIYSITVDTTLCFRARIDSGLTGLTQTLKRDERYCTSEATTTSNGHHLRFRIRLSRGEHEIERIIIRSYDDPYGPIQVGLDYFTQSVFLRYDFPDAADLEAYGHGGFHGRISGSRLPTDQVEDTKSFRQWFTDAWLPRGSNIMLMLAPARRSVPPRSP